MRSKQSTIETSIESNNRLPRGKPDAAFRGIGALFSAIFLSTTGRLILLSFTVTLIAGVIYRDEFLLWVRWSALPLGLWFASLTIPLITHPRVFKRTWRYLIGMLVLAFTLAGILAFFNAGALGLGPDGEPVGGRISRIITTLPFSPDETRQFYIGGIIRLSILSIIGFLILYPRILIITKNGLQLFIALVLIAIAGAISKFRSSKSKVQVQIADKERDGMENIKQDLLSAYMNNKETTQTTQTPYHSEENKRWQGTTKYPDAEELPSALFPNQPQRENLEDTSGGVVQTLNISRTNEGLVGDYSRIEESNLAPSPTERGAKSGLYSRYKGTLSNTDVDSILSNMRGTPIDDSSQRRTQSRFSSSSRWRPQLSSGEAQNDTDFFQTSEDIGFERRADASGAVTMTGQESDIYNLSGVVSIDNDASLKEKRKPPIRENFTRASHASSMANQHDAFSFSQTKRSSITGSRFEALHPNEETHDELQLSTARGGRHIDCPVPDKSLLLEATPGGITREETERTSALIESSLAEHSIQVTVDKAFVGPTVTTYGLTPGWRRGTDSPVRVRVDSILSREKDLALALASPSLRFLTVVPGESMVGLEVPNSKPTPVTLRSVIDTPEWSEMDISKALPFPLGINSNGLPVAADLADMPHLLVAGATGSGKSVCINSIITGLLLSRTPRQMRLILIDPKRVELTPYEGIPHLYSPVIVEPKEAVTVLKALVKEMERRLYTMQQMGAKNLSTFNALNDSEQMPYIVVVVDELADLMITASAEVEKSLIRLSQLARATGIHMVLATQRPSVDVVTGQIKANFPSRICFSVMSQVDSRTVLDMVGGEKLLGRGDMLFLPSTLMHPERIQGAFLSDMEIARIIEYWKRMPVPPDLPRLMLEDDSYDYDTPEGNSAMGDSLFKSAVALARNQKTLSVSLFQRRLKIGFPRAARLMDELEDAGIVGSGESGKPRQVLLN